MLLAVQQSVATQVLCVRAGHSDQRPRKDNVVKNRAASLACVCSFLSLSSFLNLWMTVTLYWRDSEEQQPIIMIFTAWYPLVWVWGPLLHVIRHCLSVPIFPVTLDHQSVQRWQTAEREIYKQNKKQSKSEVGMWRWQSWKIKNEKSYNPAKILQPCKVPCHLQEDTRAHCSSQYDSILFDKWWHTSLLKGQFTFRSGHLYSTKIRERWERWCMTSSCVGPAASRVCVGFL